MKQKRAREGPFRLVTCPKGLGLLDLAGLLAAALAVVLEHEGDLVTLVEGPDARGLEGSGVHEHVLAAVSRSDEAVTFCAVEEFDGAGHSHGRKSFPGRCVRKPVKRAARSARQLRLGKANRPDGELSSSKFVRRAPVLGCTGSAVYAP